MAAVGGRMESLERKRSLFGPDYFLLAMLALVSVGIHGWLLEHTKVTARDSLGFGRYAYDFQSPESSLPGGLHPDRQKVDVVRAQQQHPGYPIAIWITAKFVRHATDLSLPESMLLAAQIANAIAAVLLVVPMYLLGRMLFGRSVGFSAALLFQVLPIPARITSDGLSEGVYLFAIGVSLMLAVRAVRRPGVGGFLATGLAVGASYLVRPEAMLLAAATGAVAGWLGYTRRWPRDLAAGRLTALAVGVALVAGPYMLVIQGFSNKPSLNHPTEPTGSPRERMLKGNAQAAAIHGPLFAKWMSFEDETGLSGRVVWGVRAAAEETVKSLFYGPAIFALAGLVFLRRRMSAEPGLWLLMLVAGLNAAGLVFLGTHKGYVSERHTVLLTLIGCLFAGAALEPVAERLLGRLPKVGFFWAGKMGPPALLVILVGLALPATLKPMHANREGHKYAGIWLQKHLKHEDCLVDPFEWALWYSERSMYYVPDDPPADPPPVVTYAVVDDKMRGDEHVRLPRWQQAKNIAADGRSEVVYHWPENVPVDQAKVKVYRLIRK
ncbi:MAG TPA: glycosyltransferase family 39 protein [Gemmataceae bacterium]